MQCNSIGLMTTVILTFRVIPCEYLLVRLSYCDELICKMAMWQKQPKLLHAHIGSNGPSCSNPCAPDSWVRFLLGSMEQLLFCNVSMALLG